MNKWDILERLWDISETVIVGLFCSATSFIGSNEVASNALNVTEVFNPSTASHVMMYGGMVATIFKLSDAKVTAFLKELSAAQNSSVAPKQQTPSNNEKTTDTQR